MQQQEKFGAAIGRQLIDHVESCKTYRDAFKGWLERGKNINTKTYRQQFEKGRIMTETVEMYAQDHGLIAVGLVLTKEQAEGLAVLLENSTLAGAVGDQLRIVEG